MDAKTSRKPRLRKWLFEQDIAMRAIADQLGISRQRCGYLLNSATITPEMHRRFVEIGIPLHLLPPVAERRFGTRKREGVPCSHSATTAERAIAN